MILRNIILQKKLSNLLILDFQLLTYQKSSNQPFEDEDGSLIFNGMIYNYIELKELLKKEKN